MKLQRLVVIGSDQLSRDRLLIQTATRQVAQLTDTSCSHGDSEATNAKVAHIGTLAADRQLQDRRNSVTC